MTHPLQCNYGKTEEKKYGHSIQLKKKMSSGWTKALDSTAQPIGKGQKVTNEEIYGSHNELYKKMDCFSKIYCFTL